MNVRQIEANVEALMASWSKDTFIYELLLAYGLPKATVTRAMKGTANMSKEPGVVQLKSKVLFKPVKGQDLHVAVEHAAKQATHKERFVIVTDFKTLLAKDMSGKATPLETPFDELHKHYAYFLPWAGLEKTAVVNENPADRKAAEKLARLYDDLKEANDVQTDEERHALNAFLTRLLFCFFAEDTGIFEDGQFSVGLGSHTADDGSDSSDYLRRLFRIMGTPEDQRESLPQHLAAFPFVGESLFGDDLPVPDITRKGRSTILAAGDLDWAAINPDIFGSMIQAVVSEENRGELGMHYTSVPNIMKVIGPLFLDELHEEFNKAQGSDTRLRKLLHRIHNLHIFDPACGSGNFLIITYKELRRLEMEILKQFNELLISGIRLDHFHGIEIDDFAHETAKLSMWLAEHQMNREFEEIMGRSVPSLPLSLSSNIVHGNACRLNWVEALGIDAESEVMIFGNPPYVGSRKQTKKLKEDVVTVLGHLKGHKSMDYILCWFYKGAMSLCEMNSRLSFVSTNSVCQGLNASIFWPNIFDKGVEVGGAYQSFVWNNNARGNATVSVVIVELRKKGVPRKKYLYSESGVRIVKSISAYLTEGGSDVIVASRTQSISRFPKISHGNMPADGGHLLMSEEELNEEVSRDAGISEFILPLLTSKTMFSGGKRFCLWLEQTNRESWSKIVSVRRRVELVQKTREISSRPHLAEIPHQFAQITQSDLGNSVAIPRVSSSRRRYVPCVVLDNSKTRVTDSLYLVQLERVFVLGVLLARLHIVWLDAFGGKMRDDFQYSKGLVYNTFPFPAVSKQKEEELAMCALRILEVRERYPDKTLAELYDPDKMPEDLLEAHRLNDEAVERCYRARPFESDEDRLQVLFDLYAKMTAEEAEKGSLFESSKTKKKRKRHA